MGRHKVAEPSEEAVAMFTAGNPATIFSSLTLIGKGNFGSVYEVGYISHWVASRL